MTVLMIIMTVMNIAMKGVERCIMKSLSSQDGACVGDPGSKLLTLQE